jgi:hypothetical protein
MARIRLPPDPFLAMATAFFQCHHIIWKNKIYSWAIQYEMNTMHAWLLQREIHQKARDIRPLAYPQGESSSQLDDSI